MNKKIMNDKKMFGQKPKLSVEFPEDFFHKRQKRGKAQKQGNSSLFHSSMEFEQWFQDTLGERHSQIVARLPQNFYKWWSAFRESYAIPQAPDTKKYLINVVTVTQRIKSNYPFLLQNISYFLYCNGIILHVLGNSQSPKKEKGLAFEDNTGFPMIVLFYDQERPRQNYFTIAHKIYDLLVDIDGGQPANKFAGTMLLRKDEILETLGLAEGEFITEDALEESLHLLYQNFPISLECIINTLSGYSLIQEGARKNFSGKRNILRRRDVIRSWHLPPDPEEILETAELLNRFEMDDEGHLSRPVGQYSDIHIAKDFDDALPAELVRDFGL